MDFPDPGRYRHFKGGVYVVTGLALHTETSEAMVIYYRAGDPEGVFARPLASWNEPANGKPRFEALL